MKKQPLITKLQRQDVQGLQSRFRKDFPLVDACWPCNHVWKSEYDTNLRDNLVNNMACAKNPIAQKVRAKFYRAAGNNQSIMAQDLHARAELVGLQEPSGIICGFAYTLPAAARRSNVIMLLIVQWKVPVSVRTADGDPPCSQLLIQAI